MTQCNTNFLAPTGFLLDIPGFKEVAFQCVSANIPGISMGGPQQATPLNDFQLSGDKLSYDTLTVRFLVDEDCKNYSLIHNWMVGITYPQKSDQWYEFAQKMTDRNFQDDNLDTIDLSLNILTSNFNTSFKCRFTDAHPVALSTLEFSTDQSDVQYLIAEATFKYVYFKLLDTRNRELTL
tara:strand:+ start:316 stop:855 length:540 start_codon:yes stop_codon:yes gene_type:complete